MATLRDTQFRPYSPGTSGFHKGPRERKRHCILQKTEDSCLERSLEPQDGTVQAFSLISLGMGSVTSTGCCPPGLWAIKSSSKEKLQPPTLTFSPGAGASSTPSFSHSQAPGGSSSPCPTSRNPLDSGPRMKAKQVTHRTLPSMEALS